MGKLIIIEGTDGSGKQTQTELIYNKLIKLEGKEKVKKISFPNYKSKASEPIKMYLAGDFGNNARDVNAYTASVFYSIDRFASFKIEWEKFYNDNGIVISDRYTTSNMIHQASKIENNIEREEYLKWLIDLEWNKIFIPEPDIVFFLDVPPDMSQRLIKNRNNKITGEIAKDIHEKDLQYLKKSYDTAKYLAKKYQWHVIDCIKDDKLKSIEDINIEIMNKIKKVL